MIVFEDLIDSHSQIDFESHITGNAASRSEQYGHFLNSFFESLQLTPDSLDRHIRTRFESEVEPFFVSTVVRGLAGSTSDIDIMAVGEGVSQAVSAMMFWEGRRIGLKAIDIDTLRAAQHELQAKFEAIKSGAFLSSGDLATSQHLKRVDLERLTNSYSLAKGAEFLTYLPALSRIAALESKREAAASLAAAHWAINCDQRKRAWAYLDIFVINAMDCVMALCGNVQSNTKWTNQRWAVFAADILHPGVAAVCSHIETLHKGLIADPESNKLEAQITLARSIFGIMSGMEGSRETYRLALAKDVGCFDFMPGSKCLSLRDRCAIVDAGRFDDLLAKDLSLSLDAQDASLALELLLCSAFSVDAVAMDDTRND